MTPTKRYIIALLVLATVAGGAWWFLREWHTVRYVRMTLGQSADCLTR